jgi:AcrR family transcriptional regulator
MPLPNPLRKSPRRYAGQSSEERQRERRQRLMATGFELFANKGYQQTPVDRICSEAKVTTRHFYQHFRNREALLEALLLQLREEMTAVVLAAMEKRSDPLQRALMTLQAFVNYYLSDARRARIGSVESVGVSPRLEALRRKSTHQFAQFISIAANELAAVGQLPDRDYHLPAIALVGASNELIVEWLTTDTGLDADQMSREILLIFRTLIAGSTQPLPAFSRDLV